MATGGFKLSLAGAKGKPGLKAPLEKPAKRRRLALGDDEPEDDNGKQEITGWDAAEGGAVDANAKKEEPKGPRVIPALPNRDWRDEARKRQLARTGAPSIENGDNVEPKEQPKIAFGLTTFDEKDAQPEEEKPEPMDVDGGAKAEDTRTEEEKLQAEAYEALVNGKSTSNTVIPISVAEEDAFQNDIRDAPEAPTLASYEATPIEGFGAALLRGMGWKDGETLDRDKKPLEKPKEIKRRPALLGIGAKPESALGIELGEWGGGKKKGGSQQKPTMYNPVTLRNKHTGEMITEEELKERLEKQKEADEKSAKNNTFVGDDEEDERRREKRKERKEKERRDDDYDSERRRDKGRRDDRRRDRDDEYSDRDRDRRREKKYSEYEDSDRDRRREKKYRDDDYDDRRRDKRRDRDSRRDRSRSPYDDERREKKRERDRRERSVESDDRREKRRERERRDRDRSKSKDSDDRRKRRRDYDYEDEKAGRRSKYKDDKYSRR